MLKIKSLKKYFGGVKAVDGCSFEVKKNTITALIGPNGAGKSTVFNLISGILKEDSGQIIFKDHNITKLSPEKVSNAGISRMFQEVRLFDNLTVKDNLFLALNSDDTKFWQNFLGLNHLDKRNEEAIKQILKKVDMFEFSGHLARDLSYGQKKLVGLARTILNPHQLLILDEPVAGINPRLRKVIADILSELKAAGETILLIEHDMNFTLSIADQIVVMDSGKVIAHGLPDEIKNDKKVLSAYLG